MGRSDLAVTVTALAALLLWDASGWDLVLARWYGTAAGFAWRHAWLTQTLLHDGGRWFGWGVWPCWRSTPGARFCRARRVPIAGAGLA